MKDLDSFLPAIVASDKIAFGKWMAEAERHLRIRLTPFAMKVDCEAVLQEALLEVWKITTRRGFEPSDESPNALLRFAVKVARNKALMEMRRYDLYKDAAETIDDVPDPNETPDPLLRKMIQECFEKLSEKPKAALSLRIHAGHLEDDLQLAERLQMKPNTFFQNIKRAREQISDCLKERGLPDVDRPR